MYFVVLATEENMCFCCSYNFLTTKPPHPLYCSGTPYSERVPHLDSSCAKVNSSKLKNVEKFKKPQWTPFFTVIVDVIQFLLLCYTSFLFPQKFHILLLLESNENVIFNYEIERWSYLEGCSVLFCSVLFCSCCLMEGNELNSRT